MICWWHPLQILVEQMLHYWGHSQVIVMMVIQQITDFHAVRVSREITERHVDAWDDSTNH